MNKIYVLCWRTSKPIDHHGITLHEIIDEILRQDLNVMIIKNGDVLTVWVDERRFRQS